MVSMRLPVLLTVPEPLHALNKAELRPGEHLIWSGQSLVKRLARRALPLALFGVPWTALAASDTVSVTGRPGGFNLFPRFGSPFGC